MKKIASIIILALLLAVSLSFAGADLKSIGNTDDALITTGGGYFKGIVVHTDGTNAVTVSIYDNTAASGTKIISTITIPTSAVNRIFALGFNDNEIPFIKGMYVDVTTSGTVTYDITFKKD
ncbi:MAG: hypothetical protein PHS93_10135 [Candidatus Omnitrophica bacterium]|nr:hypothetical protein [Candidatus Omnitrophota bacterium]MDD5540752.1 hypothetical protein [Candidatus Neomarinimicrobiota bacterium]